MDSCRSLACTLAAALLLLLPGWTGARAEPGYAERAAALVQAHVEADRFSGAVLVAKDGAPVFRQAFGFANREWDIPNTPETRFRTGSIAKQFAAAAILVLADRGVLGLDDPVSRHYAAAPPAWSAITLRHLLSMRSGIPSYTRLPGFFAGPAKGEHTLDQLIALFRDAPLRFEPGSRHDYSNSNYVLIGAVVEAASGQTYDRFLQDSIFRPLGMGRSAYDDNATIIAERAAGYRRAQEQWRNAAHISMSVVRAAGAALTTVDDLLVWDRALSAKGFLRADSLKAMFTDYGDGYGLAWVAPAWLGSAVQTHSGNIDGFATTICRFTDERLTVIVLANLERAPTLRIANELAELHFAEVGRFFRPCPASP
jgi:D-alanyl-D-alanine carboxypeptidase